MFPKYTIRRTPPGVIRPENNSTEMIPKHRVSPEPLCTDASKQPIEVYPMTMTFTNNPDNLDIVFTPKK